MKIKVHYTVLYVLLVSMLMLSPGRTAHAQFGVDEVTTDTLTLEKLRKDPHGFYLDEKWLMKFGDNPTWKEPDFDALGWQIHSSRFEPSELKDWKGMAWFRKVLHIHEELDGKPLFMALATNSAVELYINGELFTVAGRVSSDPKSEKLVRSDTLRYLPLKAGQSYLFAARVSNHALPSLFGDVMPGFRLVFDRVDRVAGDYFTHPSNKMSVDRRKVHNISLIVVSAMSASVFFIHILMFFFYRDRVDNLYYALAMLLHIGALMSNYYLLNGSSVLWVERFMYLSDVFYITMAYSMTFYFYEVCHVRKSHLFGAITGLLILLALSMMFFRDPIVMVILTTLYLGLIVVDAIRVFIQGIKYRNKMMHFLLWPSIISISYFIVRNGVALFGSREMGLLFNSITEYGMIPLILGMSFYLAFDLADTSLRLRVKLDENKKLAARNLEEEKRNAALKIEKEREEARAKLAELQTEVLHKENERKSKELEEARQLQLSLLPVHAPKIKHWDIDFRMSTSSEVGGDYYDYILQSEEEFILGIGDATGHGLKAGSMVTAVKALFQVLGDKATPDEVLQAMSKQLRQIGFHRTFMTFTLARFWQNRMMVSNAGMPFPMIYRAKTGQVEEVALRGMPLSSPAHFEYDIKVFDVQKNDVIVFFSDGLPETFNPKREMLDLQPIRETIIREADKTCSSITKALFDLAHDWQKEAPQHDDISIIVMKYDNED